MAFPTILVSIILWTLIYNCPAHSSHIEQNKQFSSWPFFSLNRKEPHSANSAYSSHKLNGRFEIVIVIYHKIVLCFHLITWKLRHKLIAAFFKFAYELPEDDWFFFVHCVRCQKSRQILWELWLMAFCPLMNWGCYRAPNIWYEYNAFFLQSKRFRRTKWDGPKTICDVWVNVKNHLRKYSAFFRVCLVASNEKAHTQHW